MIENMKNGCHKDLNEVEKFKCNLLDTSKSEEEIIETGKRTYEEVISFVRDIDVVTIPQAKLYKYLKPICDEKEWTIKTSSRFLFTDRKFISDILIFAGNKIISISYDGFDHGRYKNILNDIEKDCLIFENHAYSIHIREKDLYSNFRLNNGSIEISMDHNSKYEEIFTYKCIRELFDYIENITDDKILYEESEFKEFSDNDVIDLVIKKNEVFGKKVEAINNDNFHIDVKFISESGLSTLKYIKNELTNKDVLTDKETKALDKLNSALSSLSCKRKTKFDFNEGYEFAKKYYESGNSLNNLDLDFVFEDYELGKFISWCLSKNRNHKLSEEQTSLLESLNIIWYKKLNKDLGLSLVKRLLSKGYDFNVDLSDSTTENYNLALNWINKIRKQPEEFKDVSNELFKLGINLSDSYVKTRRQFLNIKYKLSNGADSLTAVEKENCRTFFKEKDFEHKSYPKEIIDLFNELGKDSYDLLMS